MNKRLIVKLAGSVLLVEAALLFVPLIISLVMHGNDWSAFALSIAITLAIGSGLFVIVSQLCLSGTRATIMALCSVGITLIGLPVYHAVKRKR